MTPSVGCVVAGRSHIAGMAKTKSKAILSVADGAGGMMEVEDRRFENGDWPIKFEVRAVV